MKASRYARMQYVTPQDLPGGWPIAPALYDPKIGMQCFQGCKEHGWFLDQPVPCRKGQDGLFSV